MEGRAQTDSGVRGLELRRWRAQLGREGVEILAAPLGGFGKAAHCRVAAYG